MVLDLAPVRLEHKLFDFIFQLNEILKNVLFLQLENKWTKRFQLVYSIFYSIDCNLLNLRRSKGINLFFVFALPILKLFNVLYSQLNILQSLNRVVRAQFGAESLFKGFHVKLTLHICDVGGCFFTESAETLL